MSLILCTWQELKSNSVYRIIQPIILEWVAVPFSRGSSQSRIFPTHISYVLLLWLEKLVPPGKPSKMYIGWSKSSHVKCKSINERVTQRSTVRTVRTRTRAQVSWITVPNCWAVQSSLWQWWHQGRGGGGSGPHQQGVVILLLSLFATTTI